MGLTRRDLLAGLGAGLLLEACSSRSAGSPVTATVTSTPSATPAATPSAGATLASLSGQLSQPLLRPASTGYSAAARLYNPRFDETSQPAAIASCQNAQDVVACVRHAADGGLPLRLRAGGHSYGGWSSGPGLVADVRAMNEVVVDTAAQTARIGSGASLIDVYAALGAKGVSLAAGSCPTVGLTGLTLGGGVGVLTREYGLTCDAVQSVQIVTADGTLREVDAKKDSDLFWALRGGGGGSFGAVTALTLQVRPAPTVHRFSLSWDESHAEAVLTAWQTWIAQADHRLWSTCKLLVRRSTGALRVSVSGTWTGAGSDLQGQLAPLLGPIGAAPATTSTHTADYAATMLVEAACSSSDTAAQCATSALDHANRKPFAATSAFLGEPLPAAGVRAAVTAVRTGLDVPDVDEAGMSFDGLGGAVASVGSADTAFGYRQALAVVQFTATWSPSVDGAPVAASAPYDTHVRALRATMQPWTGNTAYVNYCDPTIDDYGAAYFGSNYARLQQVKQTYDPHAVFAFPQAVKASR